MSKPVFYRQCWLRRGNTRMMSWIPESAAHLGWRVELLDGLGSGGDKWLVEHVSVGRETEDGVKGMLREQRHWKNDGSLVNA